MSKLAVTVLVRMNLREGQVPVAKVIFQEWCEFLKKKTTCDEVDLLCFTETQLVWLEKWESKQVLDEFYAAHFSMSDFAARMFDCCSGAPKRVTYLEAR